LLRGAALVTRRNATGVVLLAIAASAGVAASRAEMSRREAAAAYAVAVHASAQARDRLAAEQRRLTARAEAAATNPILVAALGTHPMEAPRLSEELRAQGWWQPVRDAFSLTRIVLGTQLWTSVGTPDPGTLDRAVVSLARKEQTAGVVAQIDGKPCFLIAVRLPVAAEGEVVLVLGQAVAPALWAAASPPAPLPERTTADLSFVLLGIANLLGVCGLVAVVGGRTRRTAGAAPAPPAIATERATPTEQQVAEVVPPEETTRDVARAWADHEAHGDHRTGAPHASGATSEVVTEAAAASTTVTDLARRGSRAAFTWAPPEGPAKPPLPPPLGLVGSSSPGPSLGPTSAPSAPAPPSVLATPVPAGPPRHPTAPGGVLVAANGQPGRSFGRYQLLDRLGEGGMAEVFTAVAHGVEGFSRVFVLKRLRPELAHDKEAIGQFIDEARMQASLVHSNIVPVFDFGRVADEYFMTQEYIVGRDLIRIIARNYEHCQQTLDPRFAYYVTHETLEALEYAHAKKDRQGQALGIVHRDVSAGNILVSARGEVKLSDFGIVKSNRRVTRTQVGMVKGNANFMSPEQARGQEVDARSDLFSIALVLYYCLTNRLLYDGDNDLEVLYKAASGPTPDDLEAIRKLPAPASDVLARALAVSPDERYQTATEFAAALAPFIAGAKNQAARLMQTLFGEELGEEAA
jgi:hypothetical protein